MAIESFHASRLRDEFLHQRFESLLDRGPGGSEHAADDWHLNWPIQPLGEWPDQPSFAFTVVSARLRSAPAAQSDLYLTDLVTTNRINGTHQPMTWRVERFQ